MFPALLLVVVAVAAGLLYVFAAVRVWRSEPRLALAMLLVWPVGAYVLARYWNREEEGVRVPLLAAFGVFALWLGFFALRPGEVAPGAVAGGGDAMDATADAHGAAQRRRALAHVATSRGRVDMPVAKASIVVPEHFRFIDRVALQRAFAGSGDGPGPRTVGWLVHERVDLAAEDAWYVDVEHFADGFVSDESFAGQSRETLLAAGQRATKALSDRQEAGEAEFSLVDYVETPRLDASRHTVAWVEEIAYTGKHAYHALDCHAVRLGRSGVLAFSITGIAPARRELCLRSVRLLAGRSSFEPGQTYADRSRLLDRKATYDLVALVTGAAPGLRRH
ncbi:DUF2167 domain-containing protein [Dokdonella fugitiva]|uniref:DUF2167 domain-containing protein n=1 Tax=Dokdonella fugitiva TaxID=328517 RepID=UPI0015FDA66E|nr:DUF2167 domain-containing protein [Dokdonella fugitiva]MBA8882200.1 putative membrane-anchored protein [Dokdonella fugitiva]